MKQAKPFDVHTHSGETASASRVREGADLY